MFHWPALRWRFEEAMSEPNQVSQIPSSSQSTPAEATPAGAELKPRTRREQIKLVLHGIEVRLRFIAIFVGIGLLMAYWTTLENYWDRWTRPSGDTTAIAADSEFYCPMHPSVIRDTLEPNGEIPDCPICGMPLSKRKKGEAAELPEGVLARLQLTPERIQLAGVRTVEASYMPLSSEVRTVGYVQYDESRLSEIVTRVKGYIERLYVDKNFEFVAAGQELAQIYSPELYSSAQELRLAQKHGNAELVANARQRLRLLGISESEIDDILRDPDAKPSLLLRSPKAGHVIRKDIVEGAAVESGVVLFQVADLSTVWIEADIYERDLSLLHTDQTVEATVEAFPGKVFQGQIALIYPELNATTRTNRVRVVLDNPGDLLRPGMFATVLIKSPVSETEPFRAQLASQRTPPPTSDEKALIAFQKNCPVTGRPLGSMGEPVKALLEGPPVYLCCEGCQDPLVENKSEYLARLAPAPANSVLAIPERAVIDTGTQQIVYVEREPGLYEGVAVKVGPRSGNFFPVLDGLAVGEKVVASGAFLLDAETRLNPAAASAYFGASGAGSAAGQSQGSESSQRKSDGPSDSDLKNIAKLSASDQQLAISQRICPVTGEPLGSMGVPIKVDLAGTAVFLCCKACLKKAQANPEATLERLRNQEPASQDRAVMKPGPAAGHQH
jgi:Cu(I)/Ag(I) efflux system membrane fusion protein